MTAAQTKAKVTATKKVAVQENDGRTAAQNKVAPTAVPTRTPVKKIAAKKTVAKKVSTRNKAVSSSTSKPRSLASVQAATKASTLPQNTVIKVASTPSPQQIKVDKAKKPKLVRDSFTMPKSEYAIIDVLKLRSNKIAQPAKKSELLRAGIKALAAMTDLQFKAVLADIPALKTGRPKSVK